MMGTVRKKTTDPSVYMFMVKPFLKAVLDANQVFYKERTTIDCT
jgi:hypothetical protein